MAAGGVGYWATGYFHTNYWHTNYWAEIGEGVSETTEEEEDVMIRPMARRSYRNRARIRTR